MLMGCLDCLGAHPIEDRNEDGTFDTIIGADEDLLSGVVDQLESPQCWPMTTEQLAERRHLGRFHAEGADHSLWFAHIIS